MTAKKMTVLAKGSMIGICLVETHTGIGTIEEEVEVAATAEVAAGVKNDHVKEIEAAAEQGVGLGAEIKMQENQNTSLIEQKHQTVTIRRAPPFPTLGQLITLCQHLVARSQLLHHHITGTAQLKTGRNSMKTKWTTVVMEDLPFPKSAVETMMKKDFV